MTSIRRHCKRCQAHRHSRTDSENCLSLYLQMLYARPWGIPLAAGKALQVRTLQLCKYGCLHIAIARASADHLSPWICSEGKWRRGEVGWWGALT